MGNEREGGGGSVIVVKIEFMGLDYGLVCRANRGQNQGYLLRFLLLLLKWWSHLLRCREYKGSIMFWEENPQFYFIWAKSPISVNDRVKNKNSKIRGEKALLLMVKKVDRIPNKVNNNVTWLSLCMVPLWLLDKGIDSQPGI